MEESRGRGFGSGIRRRSRGRRPGVPRNYGDPRAIAALDAKKSETVERLEQNHQLAQAAANRPRQPKVTSVIDEGKQVLSKFFSGFSESNRGNIKVHLDNTFVNRIAEPFFDKLDEAAKELADPLVTTNTLEDEQKRLARKLTGSFDIATAIKLYRSATANTKDKLSSLTSIRNSNIHVPRRVGVILNQLGKTDLGNDQRIRIQSQDMAVKRHLMRGIVRYTDKKKLEGYMIDKSMYKEFVNRASAGKSLDRMVDSTASSVEYIQDMAQNMFDELRETAFTVGIFDANKGAVSVQLSMPPFSFKDATPQDVVTYVSNPLLSIAVFAKNRDFWMAISSVVLSQLDKRWLKNYDKPVSTYLQTNVADIDSLKIHEVFEALELWTYESYIDVESFNDLATDAIHDWNNNISARLKTFIRFEDLNFTEFGGDAQIIQVDGKKISKNNNQWKQYLRESHDISINVIKGKAKAECGIKTSESGAIIGAFTSFSKMVEYDANFELAFVGKNREILREFLKPDFY